MLSWFHKYQKIMLGVFGVGLMFVFTVSLGSGVDPIMDRLSGRTSGGPSKEVAVTWKGGQLDTQSLDRQRVQRNLLGRFMGRVARLAQERGGRQRVSMLPLYSGDRSIVELEVLANEATKMGIEVNDETVIDYLNQLTDGTILPSEYAAILRDSTGNNLPENALFPLLARELKAQKVRGLIQSGNFPASPIAAWDYYNRLNRLVKAEIMPISVNDFIDQVDEPSETEVAEMFDKYKRFYPMAMSPEPGFRIREQRAFQYVKVNYDAILENEKAGITDAEIQAYYNENKEQYVIQKEGALDLDGLPGDSSTPAGTGEATTDGASTEGVSIDDSATATDAAAEAVETVADEVSSAVKSAEAVDAATESAESPTPSPTALPQEASESVAEAVTGTAQEVADTVTEAATNAVEKATNPLRTAVDETTEATATGEETAATEASDVAPEAEAPEAEAPEAVASTQEAAAESTTSAEPTTTESTSDATDSSSETGETPADEVVDNSDLDDISSYKDISEVADEIRQSLAAPKAQIKMKQMLDTISRDMERYFQDRTLWEMDVEENPDAPKPTMPDFGGIVDGTQATMGEIGLSDRVAIEDHELGQAFDIAIYGRENIQRVTFADSAYQASMSPYRPNVFPKLDMATDRYVYWMTEKVDEYIPELDEVRTQVVDACKRQRALEVAKKEAEALAAKAEQANTTLQASLSNDKYTQFIDTGEISWVTAPLQEGATPSITPITGAEDAGPELRKELFGLKPGGVGYAANMPKDKVYVFRVTEETPDIEIRREQFRQNGVDAPLLFLARRDSMISLSEWYRDLTDEIGMDWQRDPKLGDNGDF